MVELENKVKKLRLQSWLELLLVIVLLVAVNFLAQYWYSRFDMTEDRRYSLGEPTKEMLRELDDIVYFRIYLDGELPSGFRRLRGSVRDMMHEFQSYAGENIQFRFIDPNAIEDRDQRRDLHQQLSANGLEPINLQVQDEGGRTERIVFPGAMVSYKDRERAAYLLQSQMGRPSEEVIHSSVIGIEYALANAIRQLKFQETKRIALIEGHGQLAPAYTQSIENELSEYYEVERVNLPRYQVGKLEQFDVAIMARPTRELREVEKYKIDQYIMNGGRMLWLVDKLAASMDSLDRSGIGFTQDYSLNLEDQLFNYGVRINYNLIQDLHSHMIPLVAGSRGPGQPAQSLEDWPFFPLVVPTSDNPIVNNLNSILFRFPSSLDTVGDESIRKEVLLQTSPYSRVMPHPVRINLQSVRQRVDQRNFGHGRQNVAVLLEGEFTSLYKDRLPQHILEAEEYGDFREKSPENRMIVVSDGKVIKNEVIGRGREQRPLPLGFDRATRQTFGNKDFIMNSIDYLIDDTGLIALRGKDYQLRLLDRGRVNQEQFRWQVVNMIVPVLIVILFGLLYNYIRKRKFAV